MALKIGELYALLTADDTKFEKTLTKAEAKLTGLAVHAAKVGKAAALAGVGIQLARSLAPAITAIVHLAVAAAPAAGALLAIPAAIAVVKAAAVVLKIGLSGVGAAMQAVASGDAQKLDESLKQLAPSARQFVLAMAAAKKTFDPIKKAVQQRLFAGLGSQMTALARRDLPAVRGGLVDVAGSLNGLGSEAIAAGSTPLFRGMLAKVLAVTATALHGFQPAIRPLITGLARLIVLGLPLVKAFAGWAAGGARTAATFFASQRAANGMQRIVARASAVFTRNSAAAGAAHTAGDQLRAVWDKLSAIGRNVARIVQGVARAMGASGGSATMLLDLVAQLTERFATWANSAEGQSQLTDLFASLQQVAKNLVEILPQLAGVLGTILSIINSLPGPVKGVALQMLAWSIVVGKLSGPIGVATKGIGKLSKVTGALGLTGANVGKAAKATGGFLGRIRDGFSSAEAAQSSFSGKAGTLGGKLRAAWDGAASSVSKVGPKLAGLGKSAGSGLSTAVQLAGAWTKAGLAAAGAAVKFLLVKTAQLAVAAATRVWAAIQLILDAELWANPIGVVILAILALIAVVVLIATHFQGFKQIMADVFGWMQTAVSAVVGFVSDHWRLIISIIGGPLGLAFALVTKYWRQIWSFVQTAVRGVLSAVGWLAALPGRVVTWFARLATGAISKAASLVSWMRGLPGRIRSAVGSLGSTLYAAGKGVISGLLRGIESKIGELRSKLSWVTNLIPSWKGPMSTDIRLLQPSGRAIMSGLTSGITDGLPDLHRTLADVTDSIGATGPASGQRSAAGDGGRSVVQLISDGSALGRLLLELIREQVRVRGGDVQVVLGQ